MARNKITVPDKFSFSTTIPVRISDINYGGHVGNDSILSIIHEARVQFLNSLGYTELNLEGKGLIMRDVAIEFKNELFYGDKILAAVAAGGFSTISFELFYKLEKISAGNKTILVAIAKTGMVYYDYTQKKIAGLPDTVIKNLKGQ
jgi:acyl-CoA thioesterase FadM